MTPEERFGNLERIVDRLAERQMSLDDALTSLIESQEQQYRLTEEQFRRTDARIEREARRTVEQFRETDRRLAEQRREMDQQLAEQRREMDQQLAEQKREAAERG